LISSLIVRILLLSGKVTKIFENSFDNMQILEKIL